MSPDAEAEARFMRMASEAGLQDCGCRVSDHGRVFNAWAHPKDCSEPFKVAQELQGGLVSDEQITAAIKALKTMIADGR